MVLLGSQCGTHHERWLGNQTNKPIHSFKSTVSNIEISTLTVWQMLLRSLLSASLPLIKSVWFEKPLVVIHRGLGRRQQVCPCGGGALYLLQSCAWISLNLASWAGKTLLCTIE
mmetsp:Transcript_12028/g.18854  ORF Transcript_12028/g.18854 Transcript_12028/m.18854 type:complete len:114 (-) Transcript_12028:1685-2026(-)